MEQFKEIEKRVEAIVQKFNQFESWEDRYKAIIAFGKELPEMKEELKTEINKVKGCQSQVWLVAELSSAKRVQFTADSDASIVKGIVAILVYVYSNATPDEILSTRPDFIDQIGLRQHLSLSRANGLSSMLKQISLFAIAFQGQIRMGLV